MKDLVGSNTSERKNLTYFITDKTRQEKPIKDGFLSANKAFISYLKSCHIGAVTQVWVKTFWGNWEKV